MPSRDLLRPLAIPSLTCALIFSSACPPGDGATSSPTAAPTAGSPSGSPTASSSAGASATASGSVGASSPSSMPATTTATATGPTASGPLASATSLELGDDGVLFVADAYGAQVVAVETGDVAPTASGAAPVYVPDIDAALGALLGAASEDVVIQDMAVNRLSNNVYFAVHLGRSVAPGAAVVRLNRDSRTLEVLDLSTLPVSTLALGGAPSFEDELQYGQSMRTLTITDLTWYDGELFIAGISNQDFDSTLRRVSWPFTAQSARATIEIYHASHDLRETHAPIVASVVHTIDGVPTLLAAYACTPLVAIPLSELTDGAHVVGKTIAELGYGNAPVDMFVYRLPPEYGGTERLLITNDQRGSVSVGIAAIAAAPALETKVLGTSGLDQMSVPLTGALHAHPLNSTFTVVVRRNVQTGRLDLMSVVTGQFFEVSESIVEYNFPNVPDSTTQQVNPIDYGFEE